MKKIKSCDLVKLRKELENSPHGVRRKQSPKASRKPHRRVSKSRKARGSRKVRGSRRRSAKNLSKRRRSKSRKSRKSRSKRRRGSKSRKSRNLKFRMMKKSKKSKELTIIEWAKAGNFTYNPEKENFIKLDGTLRYVVPFDAMMNLYEKRHRKPTKSAASRGVTKSASSRGVTKK